MPLRRMVPSSATVKEARAACRPAPRWFGVSASELPGVLPQYSQFIQYGAGNVLDPLDALQIADVDFYGDSYGTYVGQVFAAWHPHRLRSLILDSAYPVRPPDVWFPTDWSTARDGLNLVCTRSPSCQSVGGTSTNRLERLLRELRMKPINGTAPDSTGLATVVTLDVPTLFLLITNLGNSPITYREFDAATRAWFDAQDSLPLLRLVAEYQTPAVSDPVDFSYGQCQAVICGEYPLLYDLNATPVLRRRQYQQMWVTCRMAATPRTAWLRSSAALSDNFRRVTPVA